MRHMLHDPCVHLTNFLDFEPEWTNFHLQTYRYVQCTFSIFPYSETSFVLRWVLSLSPSFAAIPFRESRNEIPLADEVGLHGLTQTRNFLSLKLNGSVPMCVILLRSTVSPLLLPLED